MTATLLSKPNRMKLRRRSVKMRWLWCRCPAGSKEKLVLNIRDTHFSFQFQELSYFIILTFILSINSPFMTWWPQRKGQREILMGIRKERFWLFSQNLSVLSRDEEHKINHTTRFFLYTFTLAKDNHKAIVVSKLQSYWCIKSYRAE